MNADEARKLSAQVEEKRKREYLEYLKGQLERVQKGIKNEAEKGKHKFDLLADENLQPDTEEWLRTNNYYISRWPTYLLMSDEEHFYHRITW